MKKKNNRTRGQAAVEFLLTYGWAMLAVLVVIGALTYFGLITPSAFLPEKCEIIVGFQCVDFLVKQDSVTLHVTNAFGEKVNLKEVSVINPENLETLCTQRRESAAQEIANGALTEIVIPCDLSTFQSDTKANLKIKIQYSKTIGGQEFPHQMTGVLYARVTQ